MADTRPISAPVRMLVFVHRDGTDGPILAWQGGDDTAEQLAMAGMDMGDHEFPMPQEMRGLLIFEGWLAWTGGPEPDVSFAGEWRMLTMWEMSRVRFGLAPWATGLS